MARLEIAPQLVRDALLGALDFAEARGDPHAEPWRRELAALEALRPIPDRERALAALASRGFERFSLDRPLRAALELHSRTASRLDVLYVRAARGATDAGSQLFARPAAHGDDACGPRLVLAILPTRFLEPRALFELAVLELLRAEDRLDPRFAGRPAPATLAGERLPRRDPVEERVRLLWDARLSGLIARLLGHAVQPPAAPADFHAAFADWGDPAAIQDLYGESWSQGLATHAELARRAQAPDPTAERVRRPLLVPPPRIAGALASAARA